MPEKRTVARANKAKREGKAPTTQAGEFVREEIEHVREGKHGARSPQQAIAIGLSKARRAGVKLPPPKKGAASESTRKQAKRDNEKGQGRKAAKKTSAKRSRASTEALKRESTKTTSKRALSTQAKKAAGRKATTRKTTARKASARKTGTGNAGAGKAAGRARKTARKRS